MTDAVEVIVRTDAALEAAHQRAQARREQEAIWRDPLLGEWLRFYSMDPNTVYAVDIALHWGEGEYTATFYCYALNEQGQKYIDSETMDAARLEPITKPIRHLPQVGKWRPTMGGGVPAEDGD